VLEQLPIGGCGNSNLPEAVRCRRAQE